MKKYTILLVLVIVATTSGCKKNNAGYNPSDRLPSEKKWVVTTVAGNGSAAFADGSALSAGFNIPEDVVVATDGTIYVADLFNSRIRKITAGQVSTLAGNGTQGIVNGNGLSSQFIYPIRITLDVNNNMYTLDGVDPRIRKISPSVDASTYAGTGTPGFNDGSASVALFKEGSGGIVSDTQGNIYVADTYNNRIRKISVIGDVTTFAGSGVPGAINAIGAIAQFHHPAGIAIDQQGNLYVADRENYRIRQIAPNGQVAVLSGSGVKGIEDGHPAIARFDQLVDMVIDKEGNLYVTDNHRIRKISKQGVVSTIAGSIAGYVDGDGASAKFNYPTGLGIDANGTIYVADAGNNRIRKISFE
jgi:NHL repeat